MRNKFLSLVLAVAMLLPFLPPVEAVGAVEHLVEVSGASADTTATFTGNETSMIVSYLPEAFGDITQDATFTVNYTFTTTQASITRDGSSAEAVKVSVSAITETALSGTLALGNGINVDVTRTAATVDDISFKLGVDFIITDSGEAEEVGSMIINDIDNMPAATSRIRRNHSLSNLTFTLVDPNVPRIGTTAVGVVFHSGAFAREGAVTITPVQPAANSGISEEFFAAEVKFEKLIYSGKGNSLSFHVTYQHIDPVTKVVTHYTDTIDYTFNNVEEYVPSTPDDDDDWDDDDEDEIEPEPLTPYIIVENYQYGGTSVTAGNNFSLKLTLKNTSETHTLQNIKMNVAPTGVFSMTTSSNTIYIEELFADSSMDIEVVLYAGLSSLDPDSKDANGVSIGFEFQYLVDKVRNSGSSSESITIPVFFPDRFEVSEPQISGWIMEGEEFSIYLPVVNKGRGDIYNLQAELEGFTSEMGQTMYIGNVGAGTESVIEYYVRADQAGDVKGTIKLTYEDANMNLKEVEVPISAMVEAMWMPEPEEPWDPGTDIPVIVEPEPEPDNTARNNVIGFCAIVIAGMSAYLTVKKAKLKRSEFDDEVL